MQRKAAIRESVKERILAGVGENELVELRFTVHDSKTELEWEHAREFEYLGEMYDVVRSVQHSDSVTYWCIHDKAETQLNRQLESLTDQAASHDPQRQASVSNYLDFLKTWSIDLPLFLLPIKEEMAGVRFVVIPHPYHFFPLPASPPPEV